MHSTTEDIPTFRIGTASGSHSREIWKRAVRNLLKDITQSKTATPRFLSHLLCSWQTSSTYLDIYCISFNLFESRFNAMV